MKKIITAVAAIAMATTMFAADVAATVKMAGSLFNLDADSNVSALKVADDATESYKAAIALSANGDKAGASVKYTNKPTLTRGDYTIWFAPADALKITLGNSDKAINQEHIDWCNSDTNVAGYGFKADVNVDALSASVMLYPGEGNFYFANKEAAQTALNVGYSADFGSIGVMADFEANFKKMAFGLGYSGAVDSTSYFVNALVYMNDGLSSIRAEAYVSTAVESVGINVFLPFTYVMKGANAWSVCGNNWHKGSIGYAGNKDGQVILGTTAKITMPVASMGAYLYIASNDWLAETLAVEVKPGLTGSVGSMGWEAALDMNINGGKFSLDVPFVATVNF